MYEKIAVFGGDGFCSWRTSLHSVAQGQDVLKADNLSRQCIYPELSLQSLTRITAIQDGVAEANENVEYLQFEFLDVATDHWGGVKLFRSFQPDAVD